MKFIDTHIHLQDYKLKSATQIIDEGVSAGVEKFVCVSATENDWDKVAALYESRPDRIIPAFGIHPWSAAMTTTGWEQRLAARLEIFPTALVGECGLDRYRDKNFSPQNQVFAKYFYLEEQVLQKFESFLQQICYLQVCHTQFQDIYKLRHLFVATQDLLKEPL